MDEIVSYIACDHNGGYWLVTRITRGNCIDTDFICRISTEELKELYPYGCLPD